jgi:hypothetical protein
VATKQKNNLEVLWQDFEKSGSVEAYLSYRQVKEAQPKAPKKAIQTKAVSKSKR